MARRLAGQRLLAIGLAALALAAAEAGAATVVVPDDDASVVHAARVAAPGDTIQVRPGTYTEAAAVEIRADGVTLEALGGRPVITGGNRKEGFWVRGADGVTIRGFDVIHRRIAVRIDDARGTQIDDVTATECDMGARVTGGTNTIITNSRFVDVHSQHAVEILRAPGSAVVATTVTRSAKEGIRVSFSGGVQLVGNVVSDSGRRGIDVRSSPQCLVANNTVERSRSQGITLSGGANGTDCQALDNTASQGMREGFEISSWNATVASNDAVGNRRDGFEADRADGLTLTGNTATSNQDDGFDVDDCDPLMITTNAALANAGYGYRVDGSPPVTTAADLVATGNGATGNVAGDFVVTP